MMRLDTGDGMALRKGIGGHQSQRAVTETWLTPPEVLAALGPFDLDPCAAPEPRPWPTAATHFTWPLQDGLALPWHGRVFLNPPYGRALGTWMARLAAHGRGTALIFARTETEAFHDAVWDEADACLFLRGRLHFHLPDGTRAHLNAGAPSVLVAYGHEDAERLAACGLPGRFIRLRGRYASARPGPLPAHAAQTWREAVTSAMRDLGGHASLGELYGVLEAHPRAAANRHWRQKVRQTVARAGLPRTGAGRYRLAA